MCFVFYSVPPYSFFKKAGVGDLLVVGKVDCCQQQSKIHNGCLFFLPLLAIVLLFLPHGAMGGGEGCNIQRKNGTPFWAKVPIPIFIDKNVLLRE
jgi:hypothetical protein